MKCKGTSYNLQGLNKYEFLNSKGSIRFSIALTFADINW